jgi:hypothetical protein
MTIDTSELGKFIDNWLTDGCSLMATSDSVAGYLLEKGANAEEIRAVVDHFFSAAMSHGKWMFLPAFGERLTTLYKLAHGTTEAPENGGNDEGWGPSHGRPPPRLAVAEIDPDGICPECGKSKMLNVGRDHWGFCDEHKTNWHIDSNLYSAWQHESEETWDANKRQLDGYRVVRPLLPKPQFCERCGSGTKGSHHPLCSFPDGIRTELSNEAVQRAVEILGRTGYRVVEEELPF